MCVCSFTPPHGFTKKTMAGEGWRLPLQLTLTLIRCQCSARVEGTSCSHFGGEGSVVSQDCGPYLPLAAPPFLSVSLLMINQTHRPLWSAVSCYLVTSRRDLPGPLVFPWRLCLLAALSRWPVATPGPDPQLPASTASWSHKAVSVCSRRTAAPHHARLVKFNFWLVGVVTDWSRQRGGERERGREMI